MAFVESDLTKLVEQAKKFIPDNSVIFRLISDIQEWRSGNLGWEQAREKIAENYGYDKYLGNCHMVPNHALIIMALLFGDDDFQKTMMIVNTAGWDTDCNSGNVGCILGIKNGIEGLKSGPDYLSPINDILYCPSASGGETLTDALTETYKIINTTRKINGLEENLPKNGARFHFDIKESTQGWRTRVGNNFCETKISNVEYKSSLGERGLKIAYKNLSEDLTSEVYVETFFPEVILDLKGKKRDDFFHYDYISCPTIFPGQKVTLEIENITKKLKEIEFAICFKKKKEDKLVLVIISKKKKLQKKIENQLKNSEVITKNDSLIIIELETQLKLKDDLIKEVTPKWYENKYLWFGYGVSAILIPIWAIGQIK